jgi:hypothetical protein
VNPSLVEARPCRPSSVCLLRAGTGGRCAHRFAGGSPEGNPPNLPNLGLALASPRLLLQGKLSRAFRRETESASPMPESPALELRAQALQTSPRPIISRAVPTIDLPDDELAAVTAALRRLIEDDKFPHAPRLDPLRAALARFDAAAATKEKLPADRPEAKPAAKAPPPAKADKRARR